MSDIRLGREQADQALKLFAEGMKQGFADAEDSGGGVLLSRAIEVLRSAFETIRETRTQANSDDD